jgi:hypothetical protein
VNKRALCVSVVVSTIGACIVLAAVVDSFFWGVLVVAVLSELMFMTRLTACDPDSLLPDGSTVLVMPAFKLRKASFVINTIFLVMIPMWAGFVVFAIFGIISHAALASYVRFDVTEYFSENRRKS